MKNVNVHTTREAWLRAGTNELLPYFASLGYALPDNIRYAISFTSGGKRGMEGECWPPEASADRHFEIIIKADREDPIEILGILVHQLIHYAYIRIMPSLAQKPLNLLMFQRCCSA
ncbi:MAG: hypothetical protein P4M13_01425 [Alphaproteobacteria bacterium]|nr:hypothetical protein [Alphaproteobacteria bacterium]